jgi:hypothetical protein
MTFSSACRVTVLLLAGLGLPTMAQAQAGAQTLLGCDVYDSCALRVRHGLLRTEIVRGTEDTPVAEIGFGTPPLEELFARSDQAALGFDRFSRDHKRASWLAVLGAAEIVGGLVARSQGEDDWAMALSISGIVIEVVGTVFRTRADEHLSTAIWWHNESLSKGSGG